MVYWVYIEIREKKMEATTLQGWDFTYGLAAQVFGSLGPWLRVGAGGLGFGVLGFRVLG